jgi:UDP-N-acetylmuramoylalanine--D-glutamate ligase
MLEPDYKGKRVTVMGLGVFTGGVEVTRYLVKKGAQVLVTDLKHKADLRASVARLSGLPVRFRLGRHAAIDFTRADIIIKSPAVPADSAYLRKAATGGSVIDTEMNMVFRLCPAPIVGITGSNGKTTTTALVAALLRQGKRPVTVGGNIGQSLISRIERVRPTARVVLELSSFQLEDLAAQQTSPQVAVVTNISPNHLDRHRTMQAYIRAKKAILRYQSAGDQAVLNYDDPRVRTWGKATRAQVYYFSTTGRVPRGAYLKKNTIFFRDNGTCQRIADAGSVLLPGDHNMQNVLAAVTVARLGQVPRSGINRVLASFKGVAHRLELVRTFKGVRYYNDSIATTPESTMAALASFDQRIILIAGGYDKKVSFDQLARMIARQAAVLVLIGATAGKIARAVSRVRNKKGLIVQPVRNLRQAIRRAAAQARKGDCVLLSPACASYDQFNNFVERGDLFKAEVKALS